MKSLIKQILNESSERPTNNFWFVAHRILEKTYFFLHSVKRAAKKIGKESEVQKAIDVCNKALNIAYGPAQPNKLMTVADYSERMPESEIKAYFTEVKKLPALLKGMFAGDVASIGYITKELKARDDIFINFADAINREAIKGIGDSRGGYRI